MVRYTHQQQTQWLASLDARPSSAAVIIQNSQEQALIVKANYKAHWSFPGGVIDAGETPLVAAVRETAEEVGLAVDPAQLRLAMTACRVSQATLSYQFIFMTSLPDEMLDDIQLQDSEIDAYRWISRAEVLQGVIPAHWALVAWANRHTGYFETAIGRDIYDSSQEKITNHKESL